MAEFDPKEPVFDNPTETEHEHEEQVRERVYSVPGTPPTSPALLAHSRRRVDFHEERQEVIVEPNFKFPDPTPPLTRKFFNNNGQPWWAWPDPIDNKVVRLSSFFVFLTALAIVIAGHECEDYQCKKNAWYWVFVLWGDFVIRVFFGPTPFSPFGMMATGILYALRVEPMLVPSQAKRFSFFLGVLLNSVVITLWWIIATKETKDFAGRPMIVLVVFAALESIGGFCVGCWFFQSFFKLRDKWQTRDDYKKLSRSDNCAKKWFNPAIDGSSSDGEKHGYDVDLVVIGAGSGGLACAKEAARLGKKVVLLDYVKPSPHGSKWGVGGTCVNVGCIPKKLFHQAGIVGHALKHDAYYYGWLQKDCEKCPNPDDYKHSWSKCRELIQEHIKSLNAGYLKGFEDVKVQYINAHGKLMDPHTVKCCTTDCTQCTTCNCETVSARRIIVATGGRPKTDDLPGKELCITSDDLFSLDEAPGRTLVIGASYIALECAGFLTALGQETVVMARSMFLRGFDRDMATRIVDNMITEGTFFVEGFSPVRFEKEGEKIRAFYKSNRKEDKGAVYSDVFDTVLMAIGRVPNTGNLGLEECGIKIAPSGKIYHYNERTTVDHIYTLGDVGEPSIELTPVAIKQGLLLANRLYNGGDSTFDFDFCPTTVFTPVEYGVIGISEEKAIEVFGDENIEVFHSEFTPLEFAVPRTKYRCYCKLIVNYRDNQRVVGFHYLGPNAGEVTQGFAAAFRAGLKKKDWDALIGIHPTTAEEMVTLRRTKKSGLDPKKTGC